MISAVVDLGTNTTKLLVAQRLSNGSIEELAQRVALTRLGEGLDAAGVISPEAETRALDAVAEFVRVAGECGAAGVVVTGTSALRDAGNRDDFIAKLRERTGVGVRVLSEEDECRYSYLAIALDPVLGKCAGVQAVADVGGGSTELTLGRGRHLTNGRSLKLGAVRLTERYLAGDPPSRKGLRDAAVESVSLLSDGAPALKISRLVTVGGSAVNLARMAREVPSDNMDGVHGAVVSLAEMQELVQRLSRSTIAERRKMVGLEPDRADVILGGAIILGAVMTVTAVSAITVSTRGLRFGVLYEQMGLDG